MTKTVAEDRSVVHSTFSIDRNYPVPLTRVFAAFSDQETKRRWFAEGEGWQIDEYGVDFRVGGREWARFRFQGGPEIRNETVYHDIVPDERIVLAYAMTVEGKCISVSLATIEFLSDGNGTQLIYTEQGAYFDDAEGPQNRETGCRGLLEALAKELEGKSER